MTGGGQICMMSLLNDLSLSLIIQPTKIHHAPHRKKNVLNRIVELLHKLDPSAQSRVPNLILPQRRIITSKSYPIHLVPQKKHFIIKTLALQIRCSDPDPSCTKFFLFFIKYLSHRGMKQLKDVSIITLYISYRYLSYQYLDNSLMSSGNLGFF